jgi:hypothetical protein
MPCRDTAPLGDGNAVQGGVYLTIAAPIEPLIP